MKVIAIDGVDGAGKSALCGMLAERFPRIVLPSASGAIGDLIRKVFEHPEMVTHSALPHLFIADAVDRYRIVDLLRADGAPLCVLERSPIASSLAYQSDAIPVDTLATILRSSLPVEDALFVLDVSAKTALKRVQARGKLNAIYETKSIDKIEARRQRYLNLASVFPEYDKQRVCVLDAETQTTEELYRAVNARLAAMRILPE